jgi:uncharacterized SAM-binding protein YcdF (DUF218 family)
VFLVGEEALKAKPDLKSRLDKAAKPKPLLRADAIVLLGGGITADSPDAGGLDVLSAGATRRTLYAAVLYRRLELPIIAAGGRLSPDSQHEPEAAVAARLLVELGVPAQRISLEDQSRNTWENATRVRERYHPRRVVLVTSAYHMPRAVACFVRLGIEVIPAPTDYIGSVSRWLLAALPDADALAGSLVALKEYVGIVAYRLLYRPPREAAVEARATAPDPSGSRGAPEN